MARSIHAVALRDPARAPLQPHLVRELLLRVGRAARVRAGRGPPAVVRVASRIHRDGDAAVAVLPMRCG